MKIWLNRWIAFLKIDDDTTKALQHLRILVEPFIDGIITVFYDHVVAGGAAALFAAPHSLERARTAQKSHWMTHLLSGGFDDGYLAAARAIGQTHYRVGVDMMQYTGAYSIILNEFIALIMKSEELPEDRRRMVRAINQAVFLDMGLAVSVYNDAFTGALESLSNELNFSLARAGEFRDNETGMHLMRMSRMCRALALAIGKDQKWADMIEVASPLHDVGKIGIPDNVLLKPGRLDKAELEVMRRHPGIGGKIIPEHHLDVIGMAKRIALTHHERWDGEGYPAGLRGPEIPLEGRIAAICDVYDALLSDRPYKRAWTIDRAVAYLQDNAGAHFDPELVGAFLSALPQMNKIRMTYDDKGADLEPVI